MKKLKYNISVLSLLICVLTLSCSSKKMKQSIITKPNIIYINVDDLGWKDVGFMGSTYFENAKHQSTFQRRAWFSPKVMLPLQIVHQAELV